MEQEIKTVIRAIENGDIRPVYFLEGDDQFIQQIFIKKLEKAFFGEAVVNRTLLTPEEMGGKEIIDRLIETDLFSSKKLFILQNPHVLREKAQKEMLAYCNSPIHNHCLIIVNEDSSKKRAFITKLRSALDSVNVRKPYEDKIRIWVQYFFNEYGRKVDRRVIDSLVEIAGDSVHHIANEVSKICIMTDKEDAITPELVYQFAGWNRDYQRWEFIASVAKKDLAKSLLTGRSLLNQNETMLSLMYPLVSFFQELLYEKMSPGTFNPRMGYIPLPPSVKKNIPQFAKKFSRQEIDHALFQLGDVDYRIKSTTISDETELVRFLFSTFKSNG
ncbi:MAG: DNA polymerase III subunit delta [Candidatus Marinimicrobia bacterium]|nr:DNA polymerase III subunit delta [Candidatus Neomarinimicrobiota bacterium]